MGFNRAATPQAYQTQRSATPRWRGQQQQANPTARPTRPAGVQRPTRPQGVGRPTQQTQYRMPNRGRQVNQQAYSRYQPPVQERGLGGKMIGAFDKAFANRGGRAPKRSSQGVTEYRPGMQKMQDPRMAARRQKWASGPQPTQQQLFDMRMKRDSPGAYYGRDEFEKGKNWAQTREGVITQSGHRMKADDLRKMGYTYRDVPRAMGGDGHIGDPRYEGTSGWVKKDTMMRNPYYKRVESWSEDAGTMGYQPKDAKTNPLYQQQITIEQYNKLKAEQDRQARYNEMMNPGGR